MHNAQGEQVWERSLDTFGKVKHGDNSSCPFMYQGQYYDSEIELAYNRFRYYDPEDGRYISQDPLGLISGEFNIYSYVHDPNGWLDYYGLKSYHRKDGTFGKKRGRPRKNKRKDRKSEYPSGYRTGVVDKVIAKHTKNGVIYDKNGRKIARKDVIMEHNQAVVDHWNNGGNNMTRAERIEFYNDTDN